MPNWLAVVVALVALFIAYLQAWTAYTKLMVDLYDRRMKLYGDCQEALSAAVRSETIKPQHGMNFYKASANAYFLFGEEVVDGLKKVEAAIVDLAQFRMTKSISPSLERTELIKKNADAEKMIGTFHNEKFGLLLEPYISLKQKRWWWWWDRKELWPSSLRWIFLARKAGTGHESADRP